jgi:hypothetical protein
MASQTATWQDVRAVRHAPPDRAAQGGARRKTFSAGFQQAHDLARAADTVGPAVKPILLFYALSQAFRAACAAKLGTAWQRTGHGLSVPGRGTPLLDAVVKAEPSSTDLFSGAMSVGKEPALTGEVRIGDLWAAHPDLVGVEVPDVTRPRPILIRTASPLRDLEAQRQAPSDRLYLLAELPEDPDSPEAFAAAIRPYPTLTGAVPAEPPTNLPIGILTPEEVRNGVVVRRLTIPIEMRPVLSAAVEGETVAAHLGRFAELAPGPIKNQVDIRWVVPALGSPPQLLGPVGMWWILLLGLASIARYHPAQWVDALNVDKSPIAVGLERVLDRAQEVLPHYVLEALATEGPD